MKVFSSKADKKLLAALNTECSTPEEHATVAARVKEALKEGADPNTWERYDNGGSGYALWIACKKMHLEAAEMLIAKGARVNETRNGPKQDSTPLLASLERNVRGEINYEIAQLLLKHKASPALTPRILNHVYWKQEEFDRTGINPYELVLSHAGAERDKLVHWQDANRQTPLFNAMLLLRAGDSTDGIRALLEAGAEWSLADQGGHTPLESMGAPHEIKTPQARELVRLLLKYGKEERRNDTWKPGGKTLIPLSGDLQMAMDRLVHIHENCPLLDTLLDAGITPSRDAITTIAQRTIPPGEEKDYMKLVRTLAHHGVSLHWHMERSTGAVAKTEIWARLKDIEPDYTRTVDQLFKHHRMRGTMSLAEWVKSEPLLMECLTLHKHGSQLLSPECWAQHPEDRAVVFSMLPAQARRWVGEFYSELEYPGCDQPNARLYDLLAQGPLSIKDVTTTEGKPTAALLSWHSELQQLTDPANWKGGMREMLSVKAILPEAISELMDTARVEREMPVEKKREASAVARYLRPDSSELGVRR